MRMGTGLFSPDQVTYWLIPGPLLFLMIHVLGLASFAYIVAKRVVPLVCGAPDFRFDRPLLRLEKILQFWIAQWKHPRYPGAGILHILIFAGFLILAFHAFHLLIFGASENIGFPGPAGTTRHFYEILTDYAATVVFACMVVAIVRRTVFRPVRYSVPSE